MAASTYARVTDEMTLGGIPAGSGPKPMRSDRYGTDACATLVRDDMNKRIDERGTYNYFYEPVPCQATSLVGGMRFPEFAVDEPAIHDTSIGYGLTDPCTVDTFNTLRADPAQLTNNRQRIQLYPRIFKGAANYRPGGDIEDQNRMIPQDTSASAQTPAKQLMEREFGWHEPLIAPVMQDMTDVNRIVEPFPRGGAPTRDDKSYACEADQAMTRNLKFV